MDLLFKRLNFNAKGAETVQVRTAVGGIGTCVLVGLCAWSRSLCQAPVHSTHPRIHHHPS